MRVGVFTGGSVPSYFAHSFNVMKMAKGFLQLGHEVEVVTADSVKARWLKRKIKDIPSHYGIQKQIKVSWLEPSFPAWVTNRTAGDCAYCRRAAQYAKNKNFDLVFCRSYLIPYYTANMGIPTVVETHTVNYDHPDLQRIFKVGELEAFKGLVTIHETIANEHAKRGIPEEKILILEDGVDLDRFDIPDDPQHWKKSLNLDLYKKYAVYCGHLYPDKGIEVILEAAKSLSEQKDLIFLLVGGMKSDRRFWESYCRKQNLFNVFFTGYVDNSLVPGYLKSADCLLLPYKMDMKHEVMDIHTTSPLKLFEYMAAKRPIVATGIPTISKLLVHNENALLADFGAEAFSKSITRCMNLDTHQKSKLSERAYASSKKYAWSQRCSEILKLLRIKAP